MIVNETAYGWDIFFQRAHSLLAGKIAFALQKDLFAFKDKYFETINAIAEHDNGQSEWKVHAHLNQKGEPIDFKDKGVDLKQAYKTVNDSKYKSLWQALLTSMHTHSLYVPYQNECPDIEKFIQEQEEFQERLFNTLGVEKALVQQEYDLFRFCDELSLALCKNSLNEESTKIGIIQGVTYHASIVKDFISIQPWCFENNYLKIVTETYPVQKKKFKTDKALWKEIENTTPEFLEYNFAAYGVL